MPPDMEEAGAETPDLVTTTARVRMTEPEGCSYATA